MKGSRRQVELSTPGLPKSRFLKEQGPLVQVLALFCYSLLYTLTCTEDGPGSLILSFETVATSQRALSSHLGHYPCPKNFDYNPQVHSRFSPHEQLPLATSPFSALSLGLRYSGIPNSSSRWPRIRMFSPPGPHTSRVHHHWHYADHLSFGSLVGRSPPRGGIGPCTRVQSAI